MGNEKNILIDKNGILIRNGDKIKKITNTNAGRLQKGVVKWDEKDDCFKCGDAILVKEYMHDFIVVGNISESIWLKLLSKFNV